MKLSFKEVGVIALVISIVIMMVIPIPKLLLDFLLIVNLAIALTILVVAMNTKESLEFSIFPTLLLITTLFRLALNVSTTRLILKDADAGHVVEAFGNFVVGGNAVIGFVMFLILMVINFIVITKGSERVAEVAARFTLDAMPGKQMSIDADLNAGTIDEKQARERRQKIERESEFYGAMDGASKFVKGDAIAGIIILLINVIGGFIIGMTIHGMSFAESAETFTMLSVGDGLVSSIPALVISTATGILVTRAASEGNLGTDVIGQLTQHPKMLYLVAGVVALLGIATPIGMVSTIPVALALSFVAFRATRSVEQKLAEAQANQITPEQEELEQTRNPENVVDLLRLDDIEFEVGYGLVSLADPKKGGDLLDRIILIRHQMALELGMIVPMIRIRDNVALGSNQYAIKIRGSVVSKGEVYLNHYLAMSPGVDDDAVTGIETVDPSFGLPALWINDDVRSRAELAGYTVVDPPSVIATHISETIRRHAPELLGRMETKSLIDNLRERYSTLVDEVVPNIFSVGEVQKILQRLLQEKVSIRNLPRILETIADYAPETRDPDQLTEYVRQALSREITSRLVDPGQPLRVITAGPSFEKSISEAVISTKDGIEFAVTPELQNKVYQRVSEQSNRLLNMGYSPIILTSPAIRIYTRQLLAGMYPDLPVVSYLEIDPSVNVVSLGALNL